MERKTTLKIKHIRCITEEMESAIKLFLNSLPPATQIIEISQSGNFMNRNLMSVIILYLN